tara:strand:+ start:944 stop:2002 length:1059 start_codon:yes stop_codon:yes gene_type:complete
MGLLDNLGLSGLGNSLSTFGKNLSNLGTNIDDQTGGLLTRLGQPDNQANLIAAASLLSGEGIPASFALRNQVRSNLLANQQFKRQREAIGLLEQQFANNPRMLGLLQANPTGFIRAMTAKELMPKDSFELVPQDDLPESLKGKGVFQRNTRTGKIFPISNTNNTGIGLLTSDQLNQLVSPTQDKIKEVEQTGSSINVPTAAGGDIGGMGTDFLNAVTGLFGGSFSKEREKQKAIINQVNNSIKQPLVKALSDKGSVYTQKTIEQILPQPSDNNQTFVEKSKALVPELQYTLNNLKAEMQSAKSTAELQQLRSQFNKIQEYIANVTVAINDYESGSTTNNLLNQADEIVGSAE